MMRICGIDPGLKGALAFVDFEIDGNQAEAISQVVEDMPVTDEIDGRPIPCPRGQSRILQEMQPDFVILEHVEPRRGDGIVSSWRFAQGFGNTMSACLLFSGAKNCVHLVRPRVWKAALGLTSCKIESLEMARDVYPGASDYLTRKMDDGRAEALLLTEYYRKILLPSGQIEVI